VEHGAFGFGRRVCTGKHIATNLLFLNIARILWACDIRPKVDENGSNNPVDQWGFSQGFISRPLPFECSISARSEERKRFAEREFEAADKYLARIMERRKV
jgi:hypothetical protein